MARSKKALLIAGMIVLLLLTAAVAGGYAVLRQGLSQHTGALSHEGLQGEVTVYRDSRGVPHIYASTMDDLMFAQGYVQAQERLWQMETHRRFVQGRLSELIGASMLETDILLRTVGLHRVAALVLEKTSPGGRQCLEAYAAGVNAYLDKGTLPPEFRALGIKPAPWTAEDSAGIVALLAYNLGGNWQAEAIRLALQEALPGDLFRELLPPHDDWETPAVWTMEKAGNGAACGLHRLLAAGDLESIAALPALGSNSWVVGPEKSATGTAILANDPHLNLSLPGIWFENHLCLDGVMDVYGWVVPGSPGVIIGHNEFVAWGATNIGDSQDLYLEKQDETNPRCFLCDDEWYEAEVITEEIRIKGRDEVETVEIIITKNGPLVASEPLLSLRWNAYDIEASTVDAILKMNEAQSWEEFREALDHFTAPIQTLVYADVEGNIAFRVVGMVPLRSGAQGLLPQPGWISENRWKGYVPMRELPELYNPADGYIATANHRVEGAGYPHLISLDVAPPYRMQRIIDLLSAGDKFSAGDFEEMQNDWFNLHAARWLPGWLEILSARSGEMSEAEQQGLSLLEEWSPHPVNLPELAAPAIFQVCYLQLMEEVFKEKMGDDLYGDFIGNAYLAYNALEYLLEKGDSAWFGGDFDGLLLAAYRRTMDQLSRDLKGAPADWQWQELQTVTFENVLGTVAVLRPIVNRGPYPYGGDHMTVGRAAYDLTNPFKVNSAAGLRFVAVMEKGAVRARGVIAGGQSGHILSPHYDDQIESWLEGRYYDLLFDREALQKTDPEVMELKR